MCRKLFGPRQNIGLKDIPFDGLSDDQIVDILIEDIDEVPVKKKIKEEIYRWHPDKFRQKLGRHFVAADKDLIMERVKTISQALNSYKI